MSKSMRDLRAPVHNITNPVCWQLCLKKLLALKKGAAVITAKGTPCELRLSISLGNLWVNTGISMGNPQVWWPADLSFWKTQVFPDLGSQSKEAGTCDRYLPYRCAINLTYIMHDILCSYVTYNHQMSQMPYLSLQTGHLWSKRNRPLNIQMFYQPITYLFWTKRWSIGFEVFQLLK